MNQEDIIDIKTRAYQEIGKLFFAVAFADKKIHANEVKQLQETYNFYNRRHSKAATRKIQLLLQEAQYSCYKKYTTFTTGGTV